MESSIHGNAKLGLNESLKAFILEILICVRAMLIALCLQVGGGGACCIVDHDLSYCKYEAPTYQFGRGGGVQEPGETPPSAVK